MGRKGYGKVVQNHHNASSFKCFLNGSPIRQPERPIAVVIASRETVYVSTSEWKKITDVVKKTGGNIPTKRGHPNDPANAVLQISIGTLRTVLEKHAFEILIKFDQAIAKYKRLKSVD